MAGTYADMATLATNNDFVAKVRVAMLKAAMEINDGTAVAAANRIGMLNLAKDILGGSEGYVAKMCWLIAGTNSTVGANAPAVPADGELSWCVNDILPKLIR